LLERGHRATEELEGSVAPGPTGEDADERRALLRRRALGDVEPQRAAALMDRLRPGRGVDHVEPVEARLAEAALLDVVRDERLARATGRIPTEVAGTGEVAVAGLDVVHLQLPARDLLARVCRVFPLRLRHRILLGCGPAHLRGALTRAPAADQRHGRLDTP